MLNLFQHEKRRKTLYPLRKTIFPGENPGAFPRSLNLHPGMLVNSKDIA